MYWGGLFTHIIQGCITGIRKITWFIWLKPVYIWPLHKPLKCAHVHNSWDVLYAKWEVAIASSSCRYQYDTDLHNEIFIILKIII